MNFVAQPIRLANIQALRGLAVLMVVLSHLQNIEHKYAGDQLLGNVFSVGFSGVDLFFAISGFVMVYVAWGAPKGARSAASFIFARASRIYPLYWFISALVLMIWFSRPDLVFASNAEFSLIKSFFLWPAHVQPLLAVGWTLVHEMYFYLVFAAIILLPPRFRFWALVLWGALVLAGFLTDVAIHGPVLKLLSHPLGFEFLGGALAALALKRFGARGWLLALWVGVVFFIAACFVSLHFGLVFWETWPRAASFAFPVSLIVYGAAGAEQAGKVFSQALVWLGDQSYALYLSHILTLSVGGRLWGLFAADGVLDNVFMLPFILGLALFTGEVLHRLVEMPLLVWARRWRRRFF